VVIEAAMNTIEQCEISDIENVLNIDNEARKVAEAQIDSLSSSK